MENQENGFTKTDHLLVEVSYEVCQQLGGIYTVLRSKSPSVASAEKRRYCMVGPYSEKTALGEFEPLPLSGPFGKTVFQLRNKGIDARYGVWLVTGKPRVVLLNPGSAHKNLADIKYFLWKDFGVSTHSHDPVVDNVLAFGYLVEEFLKTLVETAGKKRFLCTHFHEWMGGYAIPRLRRSGLPAATVFTTHATLLGRYLAQNDPQKARDIAEALETYNRQLYRTLRNLQRKGIVSASQDRPALFSAVSFDKVLDQFIEANREEAQRIEQNKEQILLMWRSKITGNFEG